MRRGQKESFKAFRVQLDSMKTEEDTHAFLKKHAGVTDEMLTMSSFVQPLANSIHNQGLGLYSYYARVTAPDPVTGEIVSGEIELTRGIESSPGAFRQLLESGLKIAAAKSLKLGLFTRITPDNVIEYVRVGTEKFIEEHDRAEAAEKKLAEREAEFNRLSAELIESHEAAMSQVKRQHQDELRSARQATDACLRADAEKIEAADRRAHGWKRAAKGIRQRYQHWKTAAITAYNVLEGRVEQPARVEAEKPPPEPVKAAKPRKIPEYKPLTPEERKERQREAGRNRWAGTTPEQRAAHMEMLRNRRTVQ